MTKKKPAKPAALQSRTAYVLCTALHSHRRETLRSTITANPLTHAHYTHTRNSNTRVGNMRVAQRDFVFCGALCSRIPVLVRNVQTNYRTQRLQISDDIQIEYIHEIKRVVYHCST
jgi:hypothetical protein